METKITTQNGQNLQEKSPKTWRQIHSLVKKDKHYELSIYNDSLTPECLSSQIAKVFKAFPNIDDKDYFNILKDRFIKNNFTDNRVKDAVNHVIDTCVYPKPAIAEFLQYDKSIKLLTYNQYAQLGELAEQYKSVKIAGCDIPLWCHVREIQKYKLPLWNNR